MGLSSLTVFTSFDLRGETPRAIGTFSGRGIGTGMPRIGTACCFLGGIILSFLGGITIDSDGSGTSLFLGGTGAGRRDSLSDAVIELGASGTGRNCSFLGGIGVGLSFMSDEITDLTVSFLGFISGVIGVTDLLG